MITLIQRVYLKPLSTRQHIPANPFPTCDEARQWVGKFVHWYNEEHRHSGIQFVTPMDRHTGRAEQVLSQRKVVYNEAKKRHPERWSGKIRNWTIAPIVWLNPDTEEKQAFEENAAYKIRQQLS